MKELRRKDLRSVSGRLERFLLARAELVLRVGTRLMVVARTFGKSDSIDALAIARAAGASPTSYTPPIGPSCAN